MAKKPTDIRVTDMVLIAVNLLIYNNNFDHVIHLYVSIILSIGDPSS